MGQRHQSPDGLVRRQEGDCGVSSKCKVHSSKFFELGLYSNRVTIHTMQLVGADRRFIARPYVRRSVAQGLVAALIALALIALAVFLVWKSHPDIYEIFTIPAFVGTALTVIASGVILCWLCSNAVVRRITRLDNDELYG